MTVRPIIAGALAMAALITPAVSSAHPRLTWGTAVRVAHMVDSDWVATNNQSPDWTNLRAVNTTGRNCSRSNSRTMYCSIAFIGTWDGYSRDECYSSLRLYMLANWRVLYYQYVGTSPCYPVSGYSADQARKSGHVVPNRNHDAQPNAATARGI
jgi:hypothetical protein